jgi:DNA-binding response OmpR family regulator
LNVDTPYRLLIVEDEPDTSAMLEEFFRLKGYRVRITAWGEKAIAQCREDPPDLIVLDVRLPDMDGYEVYARVRQQLRTRYTPVIFLTEKRSRDNKLTGLQLGAVDYMTKPFDPEELSLRVYNALGWIEHAKTINPVTKLPIGRRLEEQLRRLASKDEWAALYVRLQNLEAFGEVYGSAASDEALRVVANLLNEVVAELGGETDFVGHLSAADFVLMTLPERVEALYQEIVTCLPHALRVLGAKYQGAAKRVMAEIPRLSVAIGQLVSDQLSPNDDQNIGRRLTGGDVPLTLLPPDS